MNIEKFAIIDPIATGANIRLLREERGLTIKDIQHYFNFEQPQAIYMWEKGVNMPKLDNLYALSYLLNVPMDRIIVGNLVPCKNAS